MLQLSKSLSKIPIISLRLGGLVGMANEPVINPHNLKVVGWWCKLRGDNTEHILLVSDVRNSTPQGLAIDDESALSHPEELVRYKEIIGAHFQLIGKLVKTKHTKLGRVDDFSYDSQSLFVKKLYVTKPLSKILSSDDNLIVDRSQIVEITDHHILVRDADVKITEKFLTENTAEALAN